jgi:FKBP-type peptidyl-prolyl cis-trans isomerase
MREANTTDEPQLTDSSSVQAWGIKPNATLVFEIEVLSQN